MSLLAILIAIPAMTWAQSLTSGDLTGTVTDPSGAAVPGATVTLKNNDTGQTQTTTSSSTGSYRFALLNPGNYSVSAQAKGFQVTNLNATVAVGQVNNLNLAMQVATASTTVEVTAQSGAIQTDNGNVSTNLSHDIVANMPNPGNDLSYFVQATPGATMNTQGGYGNSATFGISATSNLFTVDGMNENDPFLNLNNSGATNLMLGANDVSTATIVNNGYTGEYGELAGANVNFVTKSGTNKFHGNLSYYWNGSAMNANDWFNNNKGTPRPFSNANQWAASVGGPIIKDKTFFFVNTEGLRLLIPTAAPVNIPSPQFESATLANLAAVGNGASVPFYNQIFSIYNNAPGASRAANSLAGGGCDPGFTLSGGAPCALSFQSNINNLTTEWILTARVDQNIGPKTRAFLHFRTDHGLQATITDPLTPVLNAQSVQPQYEGQFQLSHQVGNNGMNQLIVAGSWYSAVFQPPSLSKAIALMPYELSFPGGQFATPGSIFYNTWPQGRDVTQYQIADDYSWVKGRNALKFGVNFRRNDITDFTPGGFLGTIPIAIFGTQLNFFNGTADVFGQAFPTRHTEPLALYALGFYAQDELTVRSNLKVTLALRLEHNSNPVCQTNCFARLNGSFLDVSHDVNQPYNQAIRTGLHQALPNYQGVSWQPRVGFAWQPMGTGKTVVRGGIGIFADIFPGTIATSFDTNSPLKNTFFVPGGVPTTGKNAGKGGLQFAPGVPANAPSVAAVSNTALLTGFASGQTFGQISQAVPLFTPPSFATAAHRIQYPTYYEWNLEVQQALGQKNTFMLNYVGNHGSNLAATNPGLNAFCDATCLPKLLPSGTPPPTAFIGLPGAPLDTRFGTITEVGNYGISNYNGMTASFTRRMSRSFQVQASFTWSHALDDVSNGGFLPFSLDTNVSIQAPQNPFNFKQYNYGNADYDTRKQANLTYTFQTPTLHRGLLNLLSSWSISGTLFVRTGLPFTVIDSAGTAALNGFNYGPGAVAAATLFANSFVGPISCSSSNVLNSFKVTPACMTPAEFSSAIVSNGVATLGNQRRNQVYGPNYFDTDLTLMKNFPIPHWEGAEFQVGATAYNILNHPNFDQPVGNITNTGQFGYSIRTVETPTSIYGSFLGANAAPRALQIRAQLRF